MTLPFLFCFAEIKHVTPELRLLLDPGSVFSMFVVFMLGMGSQNFVFILTLMSYTGFVLVNRFPPYLTGKVLFWFMIAGLIMYRVTFP